MRKHNKIIKEWADNSELIVFVKTCAEGAWTVAKEPVQWWGDNEYFASLPQHKEACLHWLNGGKSQLEYTHSSYPTWNDIDNDATDWSTGHVFMDESLKIRIKPRKEKRWIGYHKYGHTTTKAYATKDDAKSDTVDHDKWQFIEIEVEV